jgi:hypothetical protein
LVERTGNDRGKLPAEGVVTRLRASGKQPATAEDVVVTGNNNVEKCVSYEYYDRRRRG